MKRIAGAVCAILLVGRVSVHAQGPDFIAVNQAFFVDYVGQCSWGGNVTATSTRPWPTGTSPGMVDGIHHIYDSRSLGHAFDLPHVTVKDAVRGNLFMRTWTFGPTPDTFDGGVPNCPLIKVGDFVEVHVRDSIGQNALIATRTCFNNTPVPGRPVPYCLYP